MAKSWWWPGPRICRWKPPEVLNQSEDDVDFWLKALPLNVQGFMRGAPCGADPGPGDDLAQARSSRGMMDPYRRSIQTLLVEDGENESWFSRAPLGSCHVAPGRATRILPTPLQRFLKRLVREWLWARQLEY